MTSKKYILACILYLVLFSPIVSAHPLTDLIAEHLCTLFQVIALITGIIATLMLTLAGMGWLGSENDPAARQKAREQFVNVLVGMLLVLISIGIVAVVTGQSPCVWPV